MINTSPSDSIDRGEDCSQSAQLSLQAALDRLWCPCPCSPSLFLRGSYVVFFTFAHGFNITTYSFALSRRFLSFGPALSSSLFVGDVIGSLICGILADRYGRRLAISFSFGCISAASVLFAFLLLFGFPRAWVVGIGVVFGVGAGMGASSIPIVLVSEIVGSQGRGALMLLFYSWWSIGSMVSAAIAWAFMPLTLFDRPNGSWILVGVNALLSFALFISNACCGVESFRFQASVEGSISKVKESLIQCDRFDSTLCCQKRTRRLPREAELFDLQVEKIMAFDWCVFFRELFGSYRVVWIFSSACALCFCGGTAYFSSVMLTPSILGPSWAYLGVLISSTCEAIGPILPALFTECIGRKPPTAIFFFLASFVSGLMLIPFLSQGLPVALMSGILRLWINAAFGGAVVLATESLPTSIRALGCNIASSLSKFGSAIVPYVCQVFPGENHRTAMVVFVILDLIGCILALLHPTESQGRALSDVSGEEKKVVNHCCMKISKCCFHRSEWERSEPVVEAQAFTICCETPFSRKTDQISSVPRHRTAEM